MTAVAAALPDPETLCACGCGNSIPKRRRRGGRPGIYIQHHQNRDVRTRLLSKLVPDPSGCLLWTGPIMNQGYGYMTVNYRHQFTHRLMWELFEGPIPDGLVIDHVKDQGCLNRHCASIAHLEPVTQRENVLRSDSPTALNAAKERCDKGHEFTFSNTRVTAKGRECRTCDQARKERASLAALTDPSTVPHGVSGYVNYRCRCDTCSSARRLDAAARQARRNLAAERPLTALQALALAAMQEAS